MLTRPDVPWQRFYGKIRVADRERVSTRHVSCLTAHWLVGSRLFLHSVTGVNEENMSRGQISSSVAVGWWTATQTQVS